MIARVLAVIAAVCLVAAAPPPRDEDKLQGVWELSKVFARGGWVPMTDTKLTIKGSSWAIKRDGKDRFTTLNIEATFKLDATKTPKAIDVTHLGKGKRRARPGIY